MGELSVVDVLSPRRITSLYVQWLLCEVAFSWSSFRPLVGWFVYCQHWLL